MSRTRERGAVSPRRGVNRCGVAVVGSLAYHLTRLVTPKPGGTTLTQGNPASYPQKPPRLAWKLAEAKAKFSEVVRLAASGRPQRVTVRGRDAVVVVGAADFDELQARAKPATLHELLSQSPLNRLDFEQEGVRSPVRDVVL